MTANNNTRAEGLKRTIRFKDNKISIITNLDFHNANTNPEERLNAFTTVLCTSGTGKIALNARDFEMKEGDLIIAMPGTILQGYGMSEDFNALGFYLSQSFFEELSSMPLGLINARAYIQEHPVIHIGRDAQKLFVQYHELIQSKLTDETPTKHHKLVMDMLMQAFMYEFHDTMESDAESLPTFKFTSGDNLYKQFVELILNSYPKPRSVEWYASQLHVTPKYLSSVTKQSCGQTALTVINRYVLEDVKRNLMRPEKTIKEVVNELNFPSISFFGKYVKKHLGKSPKFYREDIRKQI